MIHQLALDGVQNTDTGSNGGLAPNMDAVAEARVLTSNYQAEHGRIAAAFINVTTKSERRSSTGSS